MLSASFASAVAVHQRGHRAAAIGFGAITAVFGYTLVTNVIERPDGIKIALIFILAILITSFASRVRRAFELRAAQVTFDEAAARFVDEAAASGPLRLIANEPHAQAQHPGVPRQGVQPARADTSRTAVPCCSWRCS